MYLSRKTRDFAVAFLPLALSPLSVLAGEAEAGGHEGLPQFDVSHYPEQVFWLVVSFAAMYVMMHFVALPRVAKTQEHRRSIISAEVKAAHEANDAALATVAAVEKSLAEARDHAHASVSAMVAKVAEEAAEHHAKKERELSRSLHSAEAEIAVDREAALKEVHSVASDLANSIVRKVLIARGRVSA